LRETVIAVLKDVAYPVEEVYYSVDYVESVLLHEVSDAVELLDVELGFQGKIIEELREAFGK
jgi:hypothetical protein